MPQLFPSTETISHYAAVRGCFEHTEKKSAGRVRSSKRIANVLTK